jgi:hypothetical protein
MAAVNFLLQLFPSYNLSISLRTLVDTNELQVTARANITMSRHGIFIAIAKMHEYLLPPLR